MISERAPILLFVYNRPAHTRRTLEALAQNKLAEESELYIYADGPRADADEAQLARIRSVREVIREQEWCKKITIIESESNKGLAGSIIAGVTEQVNAFGKAIVLEDDLVTARGFLEYMNEALDRYRDAPQVMQVSGHQFPLSIPAKNQAIFLPLTTSWGWATWKRAWDHFDPSATGYEALKTDRKLRSAFDLNDSYPYSKMLVNQMEKGNISSWAIRWWWTVFKSGGLSLYPDKSLVSNIGFDQDASHTTQADPFANTDFNPEYVIINFPKQIVANEQHFRLLKNLLISSRVGGSLIVGKVKSIVKRLLNV